MSSEDLLDDIAKSLAVMIVLCRSAAHCYRKGNERRRYVMTFLEDLDLNNILIYGTRISDELMVSRIRARQAEKLDSRIEVLVNFCVGAFSTRRLLEIFNGLNGRTPGPRTERGPDSLEPDSTPGDGNLQSYIVDERLMVVDGVVDDEDMPYILGNLERSDDNVNLNYEPPIIVDNTDNNVPPIQANNTSSIYLRNYDAFLFEKLVNTIVNIVESDEYGNRFNSVDIKIEFTREIDMCLALGLAGVMDTNTMYIRPADYILAAATKGLFTKAASMGGESLCYMSYLYGSNVILTDSAIEDTGLFREVGELVFRKMAISSSRLKVLSDKLVEMAGDRFSLKTLSDLDITIQLTFTLGKRTYSAAMMYLRANDPCDEVTVVKKEFLSSMCHCENRTCTWRLCCIITPVGLTSLDEHDSDDIALLVIQIFKAAVYIQPDLLDVVSGFTGMVIPHLANDPESLGCVGNNSSTKLTGKVNSTNSRVCSFHSFLAANSELPWTLIHLPTGLKTLFTEFQQVLLVHRPVFSIQSIMRMGISNKLFTHYKTFTDYFTRHVFLDRRVVINGYSRLARGVAFQSYDNGYLILRANQITHRICTMNSLYDGLIVKAPSQLYVTADVMTGLGFNIGSSFEFSKLNGVYTRSFDHFDRRTNKTCTVICSVPIKILAENEIITVGDEETTEIVDEFKLLRFDESVVGAVPTTTDQDSDSEVKSMYSPLNQFSSDGTRISPELSKYYTISWYDIKEFWPGVKIFRMNLGVSIKRSLSRNNTDDIIVNPSPTDLVNFTIFTTGSDVAYKPMSGEKLALFSHHCYATKTLDPPTLFTLQRILSIGTL